MADIELVIKLNEDIAQGIIDGENDAPRNIVRSFQATIADAIKNGTPLPKGCGRLIDAREYENSIRKHYFDNATVIRCTEIALGNAQTIIEADKENER